MLLLELLKLLLLDLKFGLELKDELCDPLLLEDLSNDLSKDLFPRSVRRSGAHCVDLIVWKGIV